MQLHHGWVIVATTAPRAARRGLHSRLRPFHYRMAQRLTTTCFARCLPLSWLFPRTGLGSYSRGRPRLGAASFAEIGADALNTGLRLPLPKAYCHEAERERDDKWANLRVEPVRRRVLFIERVRCSFRSRTRAVLAIVKCQQNDAEILDIHRVSPEAGSIQVGIGYVLSRRGRSVRKATLAGRTGKPGSLSLDLRMPGHRNALC